MDGFGWRFGLVAGLVLVGLGGRASAQVTPAGAPADAPTGNGQAALQQVAGILDYIAGDYRGAVAADGRVIDASELAEQQSLAKDADALAAQAAVADNDSLRVELQAIAQALADKKPPEVVSGLCRDARGAVQAHGVDLAPATIPSKPDAARLFVSQACNTCHGDDGSANTPAAQALVPHPANFLDPERVATVSAHRAQHAITFGVPGTAMKSFAALSEADRWSLAFYVLSLRHASADLTRGKRVFDDADKPAPDTARGLASLTEEELIAKLGVIKNAKDRAVALAYLRADAPFRTPDDNGSLSIAYQKLDQGLSAYRGGDHAAARQLFVSAYLDGFEPHEATLRAHDAKLLTEVEKAMLGIRSSAADGAPLATIEAQAKIIRRLLARAESLRGGASAALFGALAITLREGLEIVLLITALLSLLRKRGHAELGRYVHLGWLLAIPAGLATFWLAGSLLGGMERELAEGIASLLAAVVLLGVTHWLLGQLGAKRWVGFLAQRMGAATSSRSAALGVLSLSFVAAYREAFEIVLFYQALVIDAGDAVGNVWLGTGIGLVALVFISYGLLRVGQKLKPAPFMLASSIFLALLSLSLVGHGMRGLQEAGVLSITPLALPELQVAGIYATSEGLIAQAVLLCFLLWSALAPWLRNRRAATTTQPSAAE